MIWNPYDILGIPSSVSDDEVKKAYRKLSRIYHPDANMNKSSAEQARAEEKFKEIQEAYKQIMKDREQATYYQGGHYGQGSPGQTGYHNYFKESAQMQAVANYLNAGHYHEALHLLNQITERNARWFYYSAIANSGLGSLANALNLGRKAVELEPGNREYAAFVDRLEYGGQWYRNKGGMYGRQTINGSNFCYTLCVVSILCNCCCRPV